MEKIKLIVKETGIRLDKYLSSHCDLSRSFLQDLIKDKKVFINGKAMKNSYKVNVDDVIEFRVPDLEEIEVIPQDIPLDILYEDEDVIVINKEKGMVVHPSAGHKDGTLVNALLFHCHDLSGINGKIRPGIVHRIDKDTSGCLVVAKNDFAHVALAKQMETKEAYREYHLIVHGNIQHESGLIDAPIGRDPKERQRMAVVEENSKPAKTHFRVLERFGQYTYLSCLLKTGRTHQIRVHMKYIQHPVLGDEKYGSACSFYDTKGQVLHAHVLKFRHPRTEKEMEFSAPLPTYFQAVLNYLDKQRRQMK
ncbi:RluA family pseudouridine synthase [Bulleidia sp. zg-1006]|uniref:RluA family pseudouridine synthase n=1 Tax=Bulleidia sp. zg-1006 TaxID=2806552 RepID=UPI00193AD1B5|nr:RluA family pseudouridine synthase [Bulleidia sp. zg-1006]QRG87418.1 RluA family pseudouridine synthase [Bulleidia sp. zg-1006]